MEQLPVRFNPAELARSACAAQTTLPVSHFSRFAAILADDSGDVKIVASFGLTEDKLPQARGRLACQVSMTCQRCQAVMQFELASEFELVFVAQEADAEELPEHIDPVILGDSEEIDVAGFIEDELILQIPPRVVHADESDCDPVVIAALADQQEPVKKHNPFAGLEDLLKN